MARIKKAFSELKKRKEKALVGYIVSGDPDISITLKAMHLMVKDCLLYTSDAADE